MSLNRDVEHGLHVRQHGKGWYSIQARVLDKSISLYQKLDSPDDAWAVGIAALAKLKATPV